jgi:outer membrane biosynthesis protein TonB
MHKRTLTALALTLLAGTASANMAPPPNIKAPALGEPSGQGKLDPNVIRRVIRLHVSEVKRCYESQLEKNPNLAGKVNVRFVVGTEGKVLESDVIESTLKDAKVERCIAAAVLLWEFPKPQGGKVTVVYPFVLASAETPAPTPPPPT